jgi:hypothetical protein
MITMAMSVITLSLSMLTIMTATHPTNPPPGWIRRGVL